MHITVLFAGRPYSPDETIELAIRIVTRERLEVARGRAYLVRDARAGTAAGPTGTGNDPMPVDNSVAVCGRTSIRAGGEKILGADLVVGPVPAAAGPTDAIEWELVVAFDTLDGRTFQNGQRVRIEPGRNAVAGEGRQG